MRIHHLLIFAGAALFAAACTAGGDPFAGPDAGGTGEDPGSEGGSDEGEGAPESSAEDWNFDEESMEGNLRVLLTDAPTDLEEVWVTVASVEIFAGEAEDDDGGDRGGDGDGDRGGADGDRGGADGDRDRDGDGGGGDRGGGDGGDGGDGDTGDGGEMSPADADEGGEAWMTLADEPQEFELLSLQDGVTDILADAALPEGHYGQIRLVVEYAEVVYEDGEVEELFIPSGEQRGIQINLGLDVEEETAYGVVLDFDAHESIVDNPQGLLMRPVIQVEYAGPIDGDDAGDGDTGDGDAGDSEDGDGDTGDGDTGDGDTGDGDTGDSEDGDGEGGDGENDDDEEGAGESGDGES